MRLSKVKISVFTLSYIFIALISNRLFYLLIYYFIGLFHELFHFFMAKSLNINVDEMVFYPFGFVIKMDTLIYQKEWKQYLVLISGPISVIFSYLLIKTAYSLGLISQYMFSHAQTANISVLFINLLPIYPLDGEKVIENIVSHFLTEIQTRYFRIIISFLTLCICIVTMFSLGNLISFLFLLYGIVCSYLDVKKEYVFYLIRRLKIQMNKRKRIVQKNAIFRFYQNYYFNGRYFENEEEIIRKIIKEEKIIFKEK